MSVARRRHPAARREGNLACSRTAVEVVDRGCGGARSSADGWWAWLQRPDALGEGVDCLIEEGEQVALAVVLLPAIEGDVDGGDQRLTDHP